MKKLHRLILRSFIGPLILTFFIVMFILLMQFLWKYIDDLVGKGLEAPVILELLFYTSATLMPMAFPLAVLLASLMTMGNLGEHNELLAMKSAGISLTRIMLPMGFLSLIIMVIAFLCADYVVPAAAVKMRTIIYSVQEQKPELIIRPGVFYNDVDDYSIRVAEVDDKTGLMRDILIYDHTRDQGNIALTRADWGYIHISDDQQYIIAQLHDGVAYEETSEHPYADGEEGYPARRVHFKRQEFVRKVEGFGFRRQSEEYFTNSYSTMGSRALYRYHDSIQQGYRQKERELLTELRHARVTLRTPASDTLGLGPQTDLYSQYAEAQDEKLPAETILAASARQLRETKSYVANFADDTRYYRKRSVRYLVEMHRKYTLSVACFLFFLIGAPLGAIVRKGGLGFPTGISVLFFIVYYVISITTEKFARQLIWSPEAGMWFSTIILIPIAIFLVYKAKTDAVLLNAEWYARFYRKVRRYLPFLRKRRAHGKQEAKK